MNASPDGAYACLPMRLSTIAVTLLCLLAPAPARAYVTLGAAETGVPAHWETLVIPFEQAGKPADLAPELATSILHDAMDTWQAVPCHLLTFSDQGAAEDLSIKVDSHNKIAWIGTGWFGSPVELALTRVTIHDQTGRIVDADMSLNDEGFTFAVAPAEGSGAFDLGGIVTHELGHVLGLAHSPVDGATMTENVRDETLALATLEPDDIVGLCSLYEPRPLPDAPTTGAIAAPPEPVTRLAFPSLVALLLVVGLALLRRAPGLVVLALVFAWPRCADEGAAPAGDTLPDVVTQDSGVDGADSPDLPDLVQGDAAAPADLQALLAATPAWKVVRWESFEQPGEGEPAPQVTDLTLPGAGELALVFEPGGALRWLGPGGDVDRGCSLLGSYEVEGSSLTWHLRVTPSFCPSEIPVHEDRFDATIDASLGTLALTLAEARSAIGTSERVLRPYRVVLSPSASTGGVAPCPALPDAVPCTLECSTEGEGLSTAPVYTLGCTTGAAICAAVAGPGGLGVTSLDCTDGCHRIECTVDGGTGGCTAVPGDLECTFPPEP